MHFPFHRAVTKSRVPGNSLGYYEFEPWLLETKLIGITKKQQTRNLQQIRKHFCIAHVNLKKCQKKALRISQKNILQKWIFFHCYVKKQRLTPNLYLQLDNCYLDCKSMHILSFCALLVKAGVFKKGQVRFSYLLVAHTYEDIDQVSVV